MSRRKFGVQRIPGFATRKNVGKPRIEKGKFLVLMDMENSLVLGGGLG